MLIHTHTADVVLQSYQSYEDSSQSQRDSPLVLSACARLQLHSETGKWRSTTQVTKLLGHGGHVDAVGGEVPQHLDELVREGVEVDVELAVCWHVSNRSHSRETSPIYRRNSLSTSFLV